MSNLDSIIKSTAKAWGANNLVIRSETQEEKDAREWREVHERFERMFKKHLGLK